MRFELVRVRSLANPGRVKKDSIFSRRNSIETAMVSVPLDVLKQYFGILEKMGLELVHNFLSIAVLWCLDVTPSREPSFRVQEREYEKEES